MFVIVMAKGAAKYQTFLWHVSRCWIYGLISPFFSLSCHRSGNEAEVQCVVHLSWTASMRHFRLFAEKKNGHQSLSRCPYYYLFRQYKYSPAQDGAALHTIGTANDILLDLEGDRECADEDTRKRVVMWRRKTQKFPLFCSLGFRYSKVFFLLSLPSSRILEEGEALFSCHQN